MYIDSLILDNVRTFTKPKSMNFLHPDREQIAGELENQQEFARIRQKNVNLLFGDNGSGKTTILETIALAALGPALPDARLNPRPLVRFKQKSESGRRRNHAKIKLSMYLHGNEKAQSTLNAVSTVRVSRQGEIEKLMFEGNGHANWDPIYETDNESFFVAAYGPTRRVGTSGEMDPENRMRTSFGRAQRIESIVQEGFPLIPLRSWFPHLAKRRNPRRAEIIALVNRLLKPTRFKFEGKDIDGEPLFYCGGIEVPFQSMSDGYRAFLGWATDLLFHLQYACPKDTRLKDMRGVVLVDEIDLHLHPKWQITVVDTVAQTFPLLQFIFASHSSLIAGRLQRMNINRLRLDYKHRSSVGRLQESVYGLDADQILLTDLFGLPSTRAPRKTEQLDDLARRAQGGDDAAAEALIVELTKGLE